VFCANRKIAETWTRNYFAAVSAMGDALSAEAESAMQNDDDDVEAEAEYRIGLSDERASDTSPQVCADQYDARRSRSQ